MEFPWHNTLLPRNIHKNKKKEKKRLLKTNVCALIFMVVLLTKAIATSGNVHKAMNGRMDKNNVVYPYSEYSTT